MNTMQQFIYAHSISLNIIMLFLLGLNRITSYKDGYKNGLKDGKIKAYEGIVKRIENTLNEPSDESKN